LRANLAYILIQEVFEYRARLLEAGGTDVGKIIGYYRQTRLLRIESGFGNPQGLVHDTSPSIGSDEELCSYHANKNQVLLDRSESCSSGCTPAQAMLITVDDDSGGGINGFDALISMDLAAGTYIIIANSILPETGRYTLETTF
jgi:hypothetical protein